MFGDMISWQGVGVHRNANEECWVLGVRGERKVFSSRNRNSVGRRTDPYVGIRVLWDFCRN
jgi:hypothetical protein